MKQTTATPQRQRSPWAAFLLCTLLTVSWIGCDSFIETEPLGELTTASFFETPAQAVQATNATYQMLRNWNVHVFAWLGMTDIASDDATKGSTPTDAAFLLEFDNLNWTPSNGAFNGTWSGYYQGIFRANVAIQGIEGMENIDANLKNRLLAENRFLRAYYYFFLVRAYGGVPLITEPLEPGEFEQQRATREEVYALIEEDLGFAVSNLPEKSAYGSGDLGRATKGAARTLLAEAHLYQNEFDQACQVGQEVISSNEYSLLPSYAQVFMPSGENSSGSIFEIQSVALEEGGAGSQYAQVQGVRGVPSIGWGFNQPSDDLVAAFEPGDPRLQATVMFPWELLPYDNPENLVVQVNPQMTSNQKAYISPNNPRGSGNGGVNIRRLRYAHLLLTTAEACARTGNEGLARDLVNQVRARARDQQVTLGFATERLADDIATEVLGLNPDGSRVMVRYVDPDSWAAPNVRSLQATRFDYSDGRVPVCVAALDVVAAVNDTPVTTMGEYEAAVNALNPGEMVDLTLLRVAQEQPCADPGTPGVSQEVVTVEARQLLPDVTASGQGLLEAIWQERRVELAMEQHRWFDIIRQGRAAQVMADVGKTFVEGKHEVYPIPQSEVEVAGLEQNNNY